MSVVVVVDILVDVEDVEDDVEVVKVVILVLVLVLVLGVVMAELIVLELDSVPGCIGKGVCTDAVDEAVDKDDLFEDKAIDLGQA